jgi:hypothetical protein
MNRIHVLGIRGLRLVAATVLVLAPVGQALAWGDEGHQIVALIAYERLDPAVKQSIDEMLAADDQVLPMRDGRMTNQSFATQATWADYFRDSQGHGGEAYLKTHKWHFADIEIQGGSLKDACFDYPELPVGVAASDGAAEDCVVDKILQFSRELGAADAQPSERRLALKYLLHFVGDIHQPLHSSDDHDAGGNGKNVSAQGVHAGKLHHYWDTELVLQIPAPQRTPEGIATYLSSRITPTMVHQWSSTDPKKWAMESFSMGKQFAYGELPAPTAKAGKTPSYRLDSEYMSDGVETVQIQLSKAGVRLANLLNASFH